MSNISEIWKPVVGYEDYYFISNFGRLKSHKDKPLKLHLDRDGYYSYRSRRDEFGKRKWLKVHRKDSWAEITV